MSSARLARIADQIQRELSELIREELRDPRVRMVTPTAYDESIERGVRLSRLIDEAVAPPPAPRRRRKAG